MSLALSPPRAAVPRTMSPWAAKTFLVGCLLAGGALWHGSDRTPADATRPIVLRGTRHIAASDATVFRIGSFNIHGGRGPAGAVDLAATAKALTAPELHFAGIYEVRGWFVSDQAEELGERVGMASLFAATERRWWHDHFGNAVLSRLPLRNAVRIDLPGTQGKRFRNAILSVIDVGGARVSVVAAHVDTETDRERQLALVFELFRALEPPAVLIGDLNCAADHPRLSELLRDPEVTDAIAAKLGPESQRGRIDHILTRGLEIRDAGVIATEASDHPHVWAELEVEE